MKFEQTFAHNNNYEENMSIRVPDKKIIHTHEFPEIRFYANFINEEWNVIPSV